MQQLIHQPILASVWKELQPRFCKEAGLARLCPPIRLPPLEKLLLHM